ncbi:hypothetical protein GF325_04625 [Candidatus Bathyarchaeota archaeon]|nr:hypothetical protein [Candidatus Bathyarchaeota archaeon]
MMDMPELVVILSFFDMKVGPVCYIEVPENKLGADIEMVLSQIFDQTATEGFFWHSITGKYKTSLNYYFEIPSEWARGYKEMLMLSIVFKEKLSSKKEHDVLSWVIDYVQKLRGKPDAYKAFYFSEKQVDDTEQAKDIEKMHGIVQKWTEELYWSTKEEIRKKTEEEIVANLMINNALLETIKYLSKRPVKLEKLKKWFKHQDYLRDFDRIISTLQDHKFIFINNIGPETYVLLVKDVKISRVPPDCLVELIEKGDERQALVEYYQKIVIDFFNKYDPSKDDPVTLYHVIAEPKQFNLISELRKGPIVKSKISKILRQGPMVARKIGILSSLKNSNVIDEFTFDGTTYLLLKTDIIINDQFPEYIQKALPDEAEEKGSNISSPVGIMGTELKGLMERENFNLGDEEDLATVEDAVLTSPEQDARADNEGAGDISDQGDPQDSPFDIIIDEISTRFMQDKNPVKNQEKNIEE